MRFAIGSATVRCKAGRKYFFVRGPLTAFAATFFIYGNHVYSSLTFLPMGFASSKVKISPGRQRGKRPAIMQGFGKIPCRRQASMVMTVTE